MSTRRARVAAKLGAAATTVGQRVGCSGGGGRPAAAAVLDPVVPRVDAGGAVNGR
uniref:Uncharacterized protein n=1 Tax=Oryza sativa subsp. japonica TaxID=39947 RepID=Q6F2F6_ORYSJ|nr:hypothetical protein [Oryza sativa Japonica Group]